MRYRIFLEGNERNEATHKFTNNWFVREWLAWCMGMREVVALLARRRLPRRVTIISYRT